MKILIAIFGLLVTFLLWSKKSLGFTNADINTATFDETNIISEYKDPLSRQFLGKLANNTAYNFRHSDQNLFIANQLFSAGGDAKTFDTDRNYIGKYVAFQYTAESSAVSFPYQMDSVANKVEYILLTTTYQTLTGVAMQIRALNGGGIQMLFTGNAIYITGTIIELRQITGS